MSKKRSQRMKPLDLKSKPPSKAAEPTFSAQQAEDGWAWMLDDGLGSVRGVVDNDSNILQTMAYDSYGNRIVANGPDQSMYGYTGEPTDLNELVYLRDRYYSPNLGTFTSQDTFEGSMNDPMSLNGYAYAHGNPVNRTDPSGHFPLPINQQINTMMQSNPLGFVQMMNSGMCGFLQQQTPPPTTPAPTITPIPTVNPRSLQDWELKLLTLAVMREAPNSPDQWEPITYIFLNRLTDTRYNWCDTTLDLRCVLLGSNLWETNVIRSYRGRFSDITARNVTPTQADYIWNNNTIVDSSPYSKENVLTVVQRVVNSYSSTSQWYGLYYFRHTSRDPELVVNQMNCIIDTNTMDTDTRSAYDLRNQQHYSTYVPENSADGSLLLSNIFSVSPDARGVCLNPTPQSTLTPTPIPGTPRPSRPE